MVTIKLKWILHYILLSIVPFFIFYIGTIFYSIQTPYYLLNWDPEYAYLYNGIAIYSGVAPSHTDHPGTTLQILIFLYFLLTEYGSSSINLYQKIIINPEAYLYAINNILLVIVSFFTFILGFYLNKKFNNILLAFISQLTILISPNAILVLGRVMPETFIISVSLFTFIIVIYSIFNKKLIVTSALIVAFGVSTKLTFLPFVAVSIFIINNKKQIFLWINYFLFGCFIFTIPWILNYKLYYYFMLWFKNLFIGSGIYGQGPQTIINFNTYIPNIIILLKQEWLFVITNIITLLLTFFVFNFNKNKYINNEFKDYKKLLYTLIIIQFMCLLMVAKHPQTIRYLIPAISICLPVFSLALYCFFSKYSFLGQKLIALIYSLSLIVFVLIILFQIDFSLINARNIKTQSLNNQLLISNKINNERYLNCIKVYRDSSNIEFAHEFGLTYAKPKKNISNFIDSHKLFKDIYFYDPNIKQYFTVSGSKIEFDAFAIDDRCIIYIDVNELKLIKE